jgi:hypothetical protein
LEDNRRQTIDKFNLKSKTVVEIPEKTSDLLDVD